MLKPRPKVIRRPADAKFSVFERGFRTREYGINNFSAEIHRTSPIKCE